MAHWWVNQNQSFLPEFRGGYLWAPLRDKAGSRKSHWDNMDDVREGDVIFHYAEQSIRSWSSAMGRAEGAKRPGELPSELWESNGRLIHADYREVRPPLGFTQIPQELKKDQGGSGPFDRNGNVKQGYLFPVNRSLGDWLRQRLRISVEGEAALQSRETPGGTANKFGSTPSAKEVADQLSIRQERYGSDSESTCSLCGTSSAVEDLWLTRIKRETFCSAEDLADLGNRPLALCIGQCDHLYLLGHIAVVASGKLIGTSRQVPAATEQAIARLEGREIKILDLASAPFFGWHKQYVYQG